MDRHEEPETIATIAAAPAPYSSLKQIIEEEASRDAAQQEAGAQEHARTRVRSTQGTASNVRDSARYGLD